MNDQYAVRAGYMTIEQNNTQYLLNRKALFSLQLPFPMCLAQSTSLINVHYLGRVDVPSWTLSWLCDFEKSSYPFRKVLGFPRVSLKRYNRWRTISWVWEAWPVNWLGVEGVHYWCTKEPLGIPRCPRRRVGGREEWLMKSGWREA